MEAGQIKTVIERALVSFTGQATSDGNAGGTTIVCSALPATRDFDGQKLIIADGTCAGQARDIDGATTSGTITVTPALSAKIVAGVNFYITTDLPMTEEAAAISAELAKVPKSDAAVTWNATALGSVNAEVDTALDTAIPGSPTADSINERVKNVDDSMGTPARSLDVILGAKWDSSGDLGTDVTSMLASLVALIASGLAYKGAVTTATDITHFKASALLGYGNGYFKNWYAYALWDADGAGAAPQGEAQPISAYLTADGDFTHTAFTAQLALTDLVLIIHPAVAYMLGLTPTRAGYLDELAAANIPADVDTIIAELAGGAGVATFPGAANIGDGVSLAEAIRAILTSLVGGDDYDGYTNINNSANVSINAIFQKIAVLFAADGANVFNPTIQGAARTNLEIALNILATYISDSAAAYSATVDPGGTARTCLETTLEDLGAILAGAGITTFPGAAAAANGVSIAEVIRYIQETLIGLEGATTLANKLTAARAGYLDWLNIGETVPTQAQVNTQVDSALDTAIPGTPTAGSINERIKTMDDAYTAARAAYLDNLIGGVTTGTFSLVNNATEQDVLEIAAATQHLDFELDASNLTKVNTIREYVKVDGTNYRCISKKIYPTDFDDESKAILLSFVQKNAAYKITAQASVAEGAARDIKYRYVTRSLS